MSLHKHGPPQPFEPAVLKLSRPDDSTVADFVLESLEEVMPAIKDAAWRDHRERALRLVEGGETRS